MLVFKNHLKELLKYCIEAKHIEDLDSLADAMLAKNFLETLQQRSDNLSYRNSQLTRNSAINMQTYFQKWHIVQTRLVD